MIAALGTALVAAAVLTLPGLPVLLALRAGLRPLTTLALLVPVSLLMIAVSAELGHLLRIPWSVLSPLLLGAAVGLGVLGVSRSRRRAREAARGGKHRGAGTVAPPRRPTPVPARPVRDTAALLGLLAGTAVLLVRQLRRMGSVDAVSQTYDAVFHYNAVRHVLREGDASAWVVGGMTDGIGDGGYYPALWHQTASLVAQLTGGDVVLASDVLMLLVGCALWPLGVVTLVRTATPAGPLGVGLAGALAGLGAAFPLGLMGWGLLLPLLLSLTLVPLVLVAAAVVLDLAPPDGGAPRGPALALLLVASCGTVTLAHAQGALATMVLVLPMLGVALLRARRARDAPTEGTTRPGPTVVQLGLLAGIALLVAVPAWVLARPPATSAVWDPTASLLEAIGQTASLSQNATPTWLPLGLVTLLALAALARRSPARWLLAPVLAASLLALAALALPVGGLRYALVGPFYSDPYRVTAIPVLVLVPAVALGLDALVGPAIRRLPGPRALRPLLGGALAASLLVLGGVGPAAAEARRAMTAQWQRDQLLTADEQRLLERVPEVVPEDAVIATNPWNGSALALAVSDREVLTVYMGFRAPEEVHLLNARLDEAHEDPEVCDAVRDLNVEYALDFGPRELQDRRASYTGLDDIARSGAAEVVLREGDVTLLRLLPCRTSDGSMTG